MKPKPSSLSAEYGAQFRDSSVAAVYRKRPTYPAAVFDRLERLLSSHDLTVLDLGCGTGEMAIPMARRVARVDALDASEPMLQVARSLGKGVSNIRWICETAEQYAYPRIYGLVVAAASLGWMDWEIVLAKLQRQLHPRGYLAIVGLESYFNAPWRDELSRIIPKYSTNQEYRRVDLVQELTSRRLYTLLGREVMPAEPFEQSVDDYVESFHARNGFSRARMSAEDAKEFDAEMRSMAGPHTEEGMLRTSVRATICWGVPGAQLCVAERGAGR